MTKPTKDKEVMTDGLTGKMANPTILPPAIPLCVCGETEGYNDDCERCQFVLRIAALEAEVERLTPTWTPMSEGEPTQGGEYLVTVDCRGPWVMRLHWLLDTKRWVHALGHDIVNVSAWMPCAEDPEPWSPPDE